MSTLFRLLLGGVPIVMTAIFSPTAQAQSPNPYRALPTMGFTAPSGTQNVPAGTRFSYVLTQTDTDTYIAGPAGSQQFYMFPDSSIVASVVQITSMAGSSYFLSNGIDSTGKQDWTVAGTAVTQVGLHSDSFKATDPNPNSILVDEDKGANRIVNVTTPP